MPTLDCNFACKYCYESRIKGFMEPHIIEGVKNYIEKSAEQHKYVQISWFGGEPLLDFSIIDEINTFAINSCEAHHSEFKSGITTNGYLINEHILQRSDDLKIMNYQITVDGSAETHDKYRPLRNGRGTFDVVFPNILKILDKTSANISLRVNVDQDNAHTVPALMDMIPEEYRTPRLQIYFRGIFACSSEEQKNEEIASRAVANHEVLRDLYIYALNHGFYAKFPVALLKDFYCQACLKNDYIIHPSGDIYKCTVEFEKGNAIGQIDQEGQLNINFGKQAKWLAHVPGDEPACRECMMLPLCQGGCRYKRLDGQKACIKEASDLQGIVEMTYLSVIYNRLDSFDEGGIE